MLLGQSLGHLGIDKARRYRVHGDAGPAYFAGPASG